MKPTDEQLKDPKWWDENAPEGATHYVKNSTFPWEKRIGAEWYYFDDDDQGWVHLQSDGDERVNTSPDRLPVIPRPAKPEPQSWDGSGLPPVGVDCRMKDDIGQFIDVHIISNFDGFSFGWSYDRRQVYFSNNPDEFRPLKTQAEREKEEVVREAEIVLVGESTNLNSRTLEALHKLYDAGILRKGDGQC